MIILTKQKLIQRQEEINGKNCIEHGLIQDSLEKDLSINPRPELIIAGLLPRLRHR